MRFLSNSRLASASIPLFLLLLTALACSPLSGGPETPGSSAVTTGVTGSVLKKDGTAAVGAYVYAYRSAKNGLRGPADFAARVDSAGHYFLDLVEGDYHLVARLRKKGADSGPPRPGDAWALFAKNPLTIGAAKVEQVNFLLQGGALPRQARKGSLTSGDTGFTGLLVDQNREPQSGALALAYRTAEFHRMPDWTSMPAGPGGRFTLFVPNGGVYCLAARMSSRGQPRAGEPYGRLGPGEESCREISDGEMLEVGEIVLQPYR